MKLRYDSSPHQSKSEVTCPCPCAPASRSHLVARFLSLLAVHHLSLPKMRTMLLVSLLMTVLCMLTPVSGAALLAIDYGTDSFKASLVKPGVAFDVLVTKEGRRKTPSLVTMRGDDRSFGGEAANLVSPGAEDGLREPCACSRRVCDGFRGETLTCHTLDQATRFPQDTFSSIKLLLGHPSTHPQSQLHQSLFPNPSMTTPRGSPSISSSSSTSFPVEEVLAMQLTYAKEMADEVAGENVRDVVMTVPGWFGQSERAAVLDAIELAGLRSIGLVNDGTAGEWSCKRATADPRNQTPSWCSSLY